MTKAALYARYSSDLQRDRSIEDQFALLEQIAAREGWTIAQRFADRAQTGTTRLDRAGLSDLMEQAKASRFSILLTESLDRLSRDQEDMAAIYKRLSFAGVRIVTANEGTADEIHVGVRSIVSSLYIQDLRHKVRRGMAGVVRDGRKPGGVPYGYRCLPGRPGELEIQPEEAAVIRRLFREYLAGTSPFQIACDLTDDAIPSANGRRWNAVSVNGMLRNPIYSGRLVWNRTRGARDPETGRKIHRANPPEEWQRAEAPGLALVSQEDFDAAQELRARLARAPLARRRRPPHMLSGLVKCGACGSAMISKGVVPSSGRRRIRCYEADQRQACEHNRCYYVDDVLARVMSELRAQLENTGAIRAALQAYREERARLAKQTALSATRLQNDLATAERRIGNIVAALADGLETASAVRASLLRLEAERDELATKLAKAKARESVVSLHPQAVERYLGLIGELSEAGRSCRPESPEAVKAFRELIESVIIHKGGGIEIRPRIASLLVGDGFNGCALHSLPTLSFMARGAA